MNAMIAFLFLQLQAEKRPEPIAAPVRAVAPEPKKAAPPAPSTLAEAHTIALADLQTIPVEEHIFIRWVWIQEPSKNSIKALSSGLNYVSRATVPVRPLPLGDGRLVRVDLRKFAPRIGDLNEWIKTWELLANDPTFSLLITKDVLENILKQAGPHPFVRVAQADGGFADVELAKFDASKVDVVRLEGPHLNIANVVALQDATQSLAPVVEYHYFLLRALTAIQDKGVFREIWGGIYYELAGVKQVQAKKEDDAKKVEAKETDEDLLFRSLGIGDVNKGITAAKIFADLRSDQRVAVFRSGITGKPRRVDLFPTLSSRHGSSIVTVTHDIRDQDVDVGQHAILNLLQVKDFAREVIFTRANGFNGYALFNADGVLQREVPPDVAVDRTIPAPHSPRLQPAISCISCHEGEGSDGYKALTNDVKALLGQKLDIFDDLSERKGDVPDTLDRLAGLYAGSPDKVLRRARDDFSENQLRVTGPWEKSAKNDQTDVIKLTANEIVGAVYRYRYDLVDAQQALRELGHVVEKEAAVKTLNELLPPDKGSIQFGIAVEDPRLGALKAGLGINRNDWALVYSYAASRVQREVMPMPREKKEAANE